MELDNKNFKSGFVAILGPTNSGKSTLLNSFLGQKVSIVSPKPQTTYHRIRGIRNTENSQIIFTDTPGFQGRKESLHKLLNDVADRNSKDSDVVLWVLDASNPGVLAQFEKLLDRMKQLSPRFPSFCALNKVDRVAKSTLLPIMEVIAKENLFKAIVPISARKGDGLSSLIELFLENLPFSPPLYPVDQVTDRDENFLLSEFVREKIYQLVKEEMPYTVWVEIEEENEQFAVESKVPNIRAIIHVDSDSRKGILIGKQGSMLKEIGIRARFEIERYLGHQICLKLHVDVDREWRRNSRRVSQYLELDNP